MDERIRRGTQWKLTTEFIHLYVNEQEREECEQRINNSFSSAGTPMQQTKEGVDAEEEEDTFPKDEVDDPWPHGGPKLDNQYYPLDASF